MILHGEESLARDRSKRNSIVDSVWRIGQHERPPAAVTPSLSPLPRDMTHVAGLWRVALSCAACAPVSAPRAEGPHAGPASEHEAKPSPPDSARVSFAPRAEVERHSPRSRLARHTHVTRRTSRRHKFAPWSQVLGIGSEVVAGGGRQREWSNSRVPWFDRYPAMASAWQMSGACQ